MIGWIILGAVLLFLAWIGLGFLTRGTPVSAVDTLGDGDPPAIEDPAFAHLIELHARVQLRSGNQAEIFINGDQTYPRLWQDLRAAERVITLQMYYCRPGRLAEELREILTERARAGVKILFLRDAFRSQDLPDKWFEPLKAAGVLCQSFRPVHWYQLHKAQHRSHIRVAVIDGRIGWTGGFGIDDKWLGDGRSRDHWRDTNVRFTGPAVEQLQAIFSDGWAEPSGQLLTGDTFFPAVQTAAGGLRAGVVHGAPTIGSTVTERLMALPIAGARERLFIANAYFVPDEDFSRLLIDAARRGVDVRILTCNRHTDVRSTWYAGRKRYERLLEGGVRIWEYQPTMMHAKTMVADGLFGAVGTINFDNRSMAFNDESMFVAYDSAFALRLEEEYFQDLQHAREIRLAEFRRRPWRDKLLERFFDLFSRLL